MTQYNNQSQSIPVKPSSANDLTNQAADGHRSNQKLTEVSSGLQPNNELPEDVDALVKLSLEIGVEKFCERVLEALSHQPKQGEPKSTGYYRLIYRW